MDDKDVVSMTDSDRPNPLNRSVRKLPAGATAVPTPAPRKENVETPLYEDLAAELGFNPMDRNDPFWNEYYQAHQRHAEARAALEKLCTVPLNLN